jgi:signal transduction histidine kinase
MTNNSERAGRTQEAVAAFAEQRERRRLAAALHDSTIQQLCLARMLMDLISEGESDDRVEKVKNLLDESLGQLRSLVWELTPAVLHQAGLVASIECLAKQLGARWRLPYRCDVSGKVPAGLPQALTESLVQGARELMTNVGRHARATACDLWLEFDEANVTLTVRDDGIGIGANPTAEPSPGAGCGYGLFSLRAQIQQLGGALSLGRGDGPGTQVTLSLPLPAGAQGKREAAVAASSGPRS